MLSSHDIVLKPSKKYIDLWCLPASSSPIIRVKDDDCKVPVDRLFKIGCRALGLAETSIAFFALFKGIAYPTKKYGINEFIILPCKTRTSIQKWCFDVIVETRRIKTDPVAYRLLAMQVKADIEFKKLHVTEKDKEELELHQNDEFRTYKQYVDVARKIKGYDSMTFKNVQVVKTTKLISATLEQGSKVELQCNLKRFKLMTEKIDLTIPWRKIRRLNDVKETKSIALEIYLAETQTFVWVEVRTIQGCLLLQAISEILEHYRKRVEKPEFKQPKWVYEASNASLMNLIKQEFTGKKSENRPKLMHFDELDSMESDEEYEHVGNSTKNSKKNSLKYTEINREQSMSKYFENAMSEGLRWSYDDNKHAFSTENSAMSNYLTNAACVILFNGNAKSVDAAIINFFEEKRLLAQTKQSAGSSYERLEVS